MLNKLLAAAMASIASSTKIEDCSTTAQISSTKADANITLAQDWRAEMLAQTEVQAKKHDCQFAFNRLRGGPDADFYDIQEGTVKYKHKQFQGKQMIRWNDNPHSNRKFFKNQMKQAKFKRVFTLNKQATKKGNPLSLFGTNGVSPNDIEQGALGNCWILSAAGSMAEVPGRVENIFINHEDTATNGISKNGIYALNLYALMMPIVVTIDDRLPLNKNVPQERMYTKIGEDGSVWAPLLEKAMAYYHGTYEAIEGGWPEIALNTLAGAPGRTYWHADNNVNKSDLWDMLVALPDNAMLQSGTAEDKNGIAGGHAYTLLRPIQVGDGPKLMEIRNPWAEYEWTGAYSDDSDLWTDDLKEAYGFTEVRNDGVFFMPYDKYWTHFDSTFVNHDTSGLFRDDWLILDDQTENSPGSTNQCGETCTRHEFTLTSSVDQKIIVSANTWQDRGYPVKCNPTGDNWHVLNVDLEDLEKWDFGTAMVEPFEMTAGEERQIFIEMDFEKREMSRDASVVVWGFEGEVTLVHNGGIASSSFATLPDDNDE